MHEANLLSGWVRDDVEEGKAEVERLNDEAKQEQSKSGKSEVEREGARVKIKRRCWNRCLVMFFEDFSPRAEWESDGDSLGFSMCVCLRYPRLCLLCLLCLSPSRM